MRSAGVPMGVWTELLLFIRRLRGGTAVLGLAASGGELSAVGFA